MAPRRIPAGEVGPTPTVRRRLRRSDGTGPGVDSSRVRARAGSCGDDSVRVEGLDLGGEVLVDEVALDRLLGREIAVGLGEFDGQDRELLDPLGAGDRPVHALDGLVDLDPD